MRNWTGRGWTLRWRGRPQQQPGPAPEKPDWERIAEEIIDAHAAQHEHTWDRAEVACAPAPGMPPVIHPAVSCACGTVIDLTCDGEGR